MRRSDVPIGMIVEHHDGRGFGFGDESGTQMMEIAGAVEHEWWELADDLVHESPHQIAGSKAAKARPPFTRIARCEAEGWGFPCGVEIQIHLRATLHETR